MSDPGSGPDRVVASGAASWATHPGALRLLRAARAKLETGHQGDRARIEVSLTGSDRDDVARLFGRTWANGDPGKGITLGLLRRTLRQKAGVELEELLAHLDPTPLRDAQAEKATARELRERLKHEMRALLSAAGIPQVGIDAVGRRPLTADAAGQALAADLAALFHAVVAGGASAGHPGRGVLLAELAQQLYGDPHGLDRDNVRGRAAARLLVASLRRDPDEIAYGAGSPAEDAMLDLGGRAMTAETWRSVWGSYGIACDRVSSTCSPLGWP
jgi:hypothetical protein